MSFFPEVTKDGRLGKEVTYTPKRGTVKVSKKWKNRLKKEKEKFESGKRPKYHDYIKSKAWRRRRVKYFKENGNKCVICKSAKEVGLHHLSYARLGKEKDEDLVALCWGCHSNFHDKYEGKGREMYANTMQYIIEEQETRELETFVKRFLPQK